MSIKNNRMVKKRGLQLKNLLKNNILSLVLLITVILAVGVIAGDVIVQNGKVTLEDDFTVDNNDLFVDVSESKVGISGQPIKDSDVLNTGIWINNTKFSIWNDGVIARVAIISNNTGFSGYQFINRTGGQFLGGWFVQGSTGDLTMWSGASTTQPQMTFDRSTGYTVIGDSMEPSAELTVNGEAYITGVSSDGNGKVVCVKSDGKLGTCSNQPGVNGTCTCG